ncbi:TQO small subunit DoxD [Psychroflexus sp. ALD_RP9]|uniref:TQO small subunit DoxD n=1 Tax=Psychroflexus sp. ALD_RP9 TaxID=2777186 RepID=UPI001A8D5AC5|nr:TQO small subunit DoxD [Psychroflexus sp. ALD_RP9]QSS96924.1 quinol oxidase [Psychroflexus sp. ALD_RP9]
MTQENQNYYAGLFSLSLRLVVGWTYFSAFWRRTILTDKLNPELPGYIGEKFNHFLPNAIGIKPIIQHLVENPDSLWVAMIGFTIIEGIVGLFIMFGLFTRLMSIGVFMLAMGILLGSGWIGTTCLDEWQIGVLGISTGFVLFMTGSSQYSIDHLLIKRFPKLSRKKWFNILGSGHLQISKSMLSKIVLYGSILIFGLTLYTNQVFHGGLWGTLHNKSVKPKIEINNAHIKGNTLNFELYRTEGVDVYGAWIINLKLKDTSNKTRFKLTAEDLASLDKSRIENFYIAKIKPGQHSLIVPLGAKANLSLVNENIAQLATGQYQLEITDISGASWSVKVLKK